MISASLLGALAGSGALPFPRETYEKTILSSGRGVKASLAAFAGGFEGARGGVPAGLPLDGAAQATSPAKASFSPSYGEKMAQPELRRRFRQVAGRPRRLVDGWRHLTARVDELAGRSPRHGAAGLAQGRRFSGRGLWPGISRAAGASSRTGQRRARLRALHRCCKTSRQRHVLRRHDPRRRSEDAFDARRARPARGRRAGRRHPADDGIFPPTRRGVLRRDAGPHRPLHRGAAETRRLHRPPHQSRPPHPHRQFFRFRHALAGRRHAPLAALAAAP